MKKVSTITGDDFPNSGKNQFHNFLKIISAVTNRRRIRFLYRGRWRLVEPYFLASYEPEGRKFLFAVQIEGESSSAVLGDVGYGWRQFSLDRIERISVDAEIFSPASADFNRDGRSQRFKRIYASVYG